MMFTHLHRRGIRIAEEREDGFTLVELMTAMAIFTALMGLVSAAMLGGLKTLGQVTAKSDQQARNSQVAETISRLLRYAVAPERGRYAIESVTANSLSFYTASGYAQSNDRPNWVRIAWDPTTKRVTLAVVPPTLNPDNDGVTSTPDTWTWANTQTAPTKVLLTSPSATAPIKFTALVRCHEAPCPTRTPGVGVTFATPTPTASPSPTSIGATEFIDSIIVTVGDPTQPSNQITQQVRLPNLYPLS
jgi:prepilin-type N-terminal cleavage/methylation domain-containing protein